MSYLVEVRHIGTDLNDPMAKMRSWLDGHGVTATEFDHSSGGPGITFRLAFTTKRDAVAFAETFRGTLNDGRDPNGSCSRQITSQPSYAR